jgi:hypothetical protein
MMVGKQQALIRYNSAGASSAEHHDSIFQAGLVDAVYIFCRKPKPFLSHFIQFLLTEKAGNPHALVGEKA